MALDILSTCSAKIEIILKNSAEIKLGDATGFFWKHSEKIYLVSNWHVFSGRRPDTGQSTHSSGAVPNYLKVIYRTKENNYSSMKIGVNIIDQNEKARWIQHPHYGQNADLAVIEIPLEKILEASNSHGDIKPFCSNENANNHDMRIYVGSDIFIVGFPLGISVEDTWPVWKRGSVASEVDLTVNDLPCFLVDSSTREGMSGSPVYARTSGLYLKEDGNSAVSGIINSRFAGVYSGRHVGILG